MPDNKLAEFQQLNVGITPLATTATSNKQFEHPLAPLWIDGENVHFDSLGVTQVSDRLILNITSTIDIPRGDILVAQRTVDSVLDVQAYFGNDTKLFRINLDNNVLTDVTGTAYTGRVHDVDTNTLASMWSIVDFGTRIFATNGKDQPQVLTDATGTNNFANLGADFTTAEIFVRRGPHMMAFNTSINEKGFVWASSSDPTDWTPTSENDAGDLIIRELESEIMAAVPLGDRVAVFGRQSAYLVSFIGGELTMGYKPVEARGIGAISKKSVVPVGKMLYGLGEGMAWVFDGTQSRRIDVGPMQQFLLNEIDERQLGKVFGYHDESRKHIVWHYVKTGSAVNSEPNAAIIYNYELSTWSFFDFGRSAGTFDRLFSNQNPLTTQLDEVIKEYGSTGVLNNKARLRTKPLDLGDPDHIKFIDAIRGNVGNATISKIQVRVAGIDTVDATPTFTSFTNIPIGGKFLDLRTSGRYIIFEFQGIDDEEWNFLGFEIYGSLDGEQ